MSAASEVNLKQTLRKIEYPQCAKEALNKIVELICGRITSLKYMDLALDLMAEFVFYEVDRRGNKRPQTISALTELQLLEILFDYFSKIQNEAVRNTVFLSLFSGTTANQRSAVLGRLVSIAVGIPSAPILISASTWMQQLGTTSANSCKLAESLVYDYFFLEPQFMDRLKSLPSIAPEFTANFLTALAENYFVSNNKKSLRFPSKYLLEMVTLWITENSTLCVAAQQKQPALPTGAIAMEATTPIAGLLRWCILAPIFEQESDDYSYLHLALLSSILEIPVTNPPKAICAQHLIPPISHINSYVTRKQQGDVKVINDECLQVALDRFGQAVQVALSVNAVYGHLDDLFTQLQQLPYNKLMNIVLRTHKLMK